MGDPVHIWATLSTFRATILGLLPGHGGGAVTPLVAPLGLHYASGGPPCCVDLTVAAPETVLVGKDSCDVARQTV